MNDGALKGGSCLAQIEHWTLNESHLSPNADNHLPLFNCFLKNETCCRASADGTQAYAREHIMVQKGDRIAAMSIHE